MVLVFCASACLQLPRPAGAPLPAAASAHAAGAARSRQSEQPGFPLDWNPGQMLMQGYLGVIYLSEFSLDRAGAPPVELEEDEYEVLPAVGGGGQWKLAGKSLDFGIEWFLAMSGRTDLEAFASSGGSAVAVFDVDLLVLEGYGGPFVSCFLGDRLRLYGGAGPLLQWVGYDQSDEANDDEDAEGSGGGVYARTGFEFLLPSGKLVGLGARWTESSVDLGGDLGDLDLSGLDVFFSYSYGLEPRSRFDWRRASP
jgi:hypothetical protein